MGNCFRRVALTTLITFLSLAARAGSVPTTQEGSERTQEANLSQILEEAGLSPEQRETLLRDLREKNALSPKERIELEEKHRIALLQTAEKADAVLRQLSALTARVEVGIQYDEYSRSLRALQDEYVAYKVANPEAADEPFARTIRNAVKTYHLALEAWDSERSAGELVKRNAGAAEAYTEAIAIRSQALDEAGRLVRFLQVMVNASKVDIATTRARPATRKSAEP